MEEFVAALNALPDGSHFGRADGKRWSVTKTPFNGGKSIKLVGEALDGSDYISLNFYALAAGPRLKPCEMPASKVIRFVLAFRPDPLDTGTSQSAGPKT